MGGHETHMRGIKSHWEKWAANNLPNEYQPFVAVAYGMIEGQGEKPTPETVRARLVSTGRDRETIIERHRRYGKTQGTPKQNQQVG